MTAALRRHYAKLCDRRDFDDPELLAVLRAILPERDPQEHIERKVWEFAMLALFLEETGHLDDRSEALAIGAGDERMVFWLANRMGRVVATDIYGLGGFADREAESSMLDNPAAHAPFPYREDHLEVHWMDARQLNFPDESFDVVFSLSSIEHFGSPRDIAQSAREMARVLRPGGHAFVVTECFVHRDPLNAAFVDFAVRALTLGRKRRIATPRRRAVVSEVFTARELMERVVEPSGLELMQPLDLSLSPETWDNLTTSLPGGGLVPATGQFYPHLLLRSDRSVFTSACLPMHKPASGA